jgi:dCMP deaminase
MWSKDPSTRVGAVLVGKDRRDIALGYNGFPPGIADRTDRLNDRDVKLRLTQHAERNVLDNARFDVSGATLYTTFFVCAECAKSVVSRGIARVVCPPAADREPWKSDAEWSQQLLMEAGVRVVRYDKESNDELA